MNKAKVSVWKGSANYEDYEEVESLVHGSLDALDLDDRFFRAGDKVVLKPNWVKEHDERFPGPDQWEHVVTHPYVIEAVISWVAPRLSGDGEIVACDAPQTDSSFARIREYCELDKMIERSQARFPELKIGLLDLRPEEWNAVDGVTVSKTKLEGDPLGSMHAKLNEDSEFIGFSGLGQLYGASYNMDETNEQHQGNKHEYMLCRTPMDADVLINIPKLKCHKKVGATVALKNLVGINANKNWLPHHTEGTPSQGGDQFPKDSAKAKLENSIMGKMKKILYGNDLLSKLFVPVKKVGRVIFGDTQSVVRSGNWHGNDTCWRMVLDLNKCLFHFNGAGELREKPLRYLAVVDGIIGGDKNGPMAPDAKPSGVVIAGSNPVSVDSVSAAMMGFDFRKLSMLTGAFAADRKPLCDFDPDEVVVHSNEPRLEKKLVDFTGDDGFAFEAHFGWVGAVEYDDRNIELAHPFPPSFRNGKSSSDKPCCRG